MLMVLGFSKLFRSKQFWVMVVLTVLPTIGYMIDGFFVTKGLSNLFGLRFFPSLWLQPYFYLQWLGKVQAVVTLGFLILGLIGIFYFKQREDRRFVIGLWLGYIIFGFVFAYYFGTHDYYHLSLVPIVAISIAPVADALWQKLNEIQNSRFARIAVGLLLTFGLAVNLWNIRTIFHKVDYRPATSGLGTDQRGSWERYLDHRAHPGLRVPLGNLQLDQSGRILAIPRGYPPARAGRHTAAGFRHPVRRSDPRDGILRGHRPGGIRRPD